MAKISTDDLLNLDTRREENKNKIQKVLLSIKPLSKFKELNEVPQFALEKVIHSMCSKYDIWVRCISQDPWSHESYDIWRAELIVNDVDRSTSQYKKIYGISIYDVLSKVVIYIYSLSKSNKLVER